MSDQAAIHEILRLQCLQALGITVYHPRFRLPGAKPSVLGPLAEIDAKARADSKPANAAPPLRMEPKVEPAAPHVEPALEPAAPRVQSRGASLSQSFAASSSASAVPGTSASSSSAPASARSADIAAAPRAVLEPAQAAPRADAGKQSVVQNFQLLFLQVDEDLAILNQIPALARPQLQERQVAFLTNLLRWLGKPMPAQTPRMFRWPLPGLEHMASSMGAGTSLLHFLEQASTERRFRFLLALGPQALAAASPGWQAFATHSVDEMLALPALKREAWQALLPLHALLAADSQSSTRR